MARPKRVAFFVDARTATPDDVDRITAHCARHWGGAFWPVVPVADGVVEDGWWRLLDAVDPDAVGALCDLPDRLVDEIHWRLGPALLVGLRDGTPAHDISDLWAGRPELAGVTVDAMPQFHAQASAWLPKRFLYLTEALGTGADLAFLRRNFGTIRPTVSTGLAYGGLAQEVVDADAIDADATDAAGVLARFSPGPQYLVIPRDLARLHAPRPFEPKPGGTSRAFTLVVGDGLDDALYTWARALLTDGTTGRETVWVSSAQARDAAFMARVGTYVAHTYGGAGHQNQGVVVSYTEDERFLRETAHALTERSWVICGAQRLAPGTLPFAGARHGGFPGVSFVWARGTMLRQVTEQIALTEDAFGGGASGLLEAPRPPFLPAGAAGAGGWMVDLDVEYDLDPPRYADRPDVWRLPRRAALGRLFARERSGRLARIVAGGRPSVEFDRDGRDVDQIDRIVIRVPAKQILVHALVNPAGPARVPAPTGARTEEPAPPYADIRTSEPGLRLLGLLDLFGGIGSVGRTLEDPFWRDVMLDAAGKPGDDVEQQSARVARELAKVYGSGEAPAPPDHEPADHDAVARRIVRALHRTDRGPKSVDLKTLRAKFGQIRGRGEDPVLKAEKFDDFARDEFAAQLEAGIWFQGVDLRCPNCGTTVWRVAEELGREVVCSACLGGFPLPPAPTWRFRLNGLVTNALAHEGLLPLVLALYAETIGARDSAVVIAPQELRGQDGGPVVTDLDVVVLRGGRFVVGEVKSQPTAIDDRVCDTLRTVATRVRPDVVLLAAPGEAWPADVTARIDALRTALAPISVNVETRHLAL